jgi:hypothetical protein
MCKRNGEFVGHLFLHCEVACDLWTFIYFSSVASGSLGFCLAE